MNEFVRNIVLKGSKMNSKTILLTVQSVKMRGFTPLPVAYEAPYVFLIEVVMS